ncbi:MAG: VOC family protein [Rikenellaceae bacterium]|nr:VOC family protein [Rikenellaceae bacterium]
MTMTSCNPTAEPKRPDLIGVSHVGFYTDSPARTAQFFTDYLGFAVAEGGLTTPGCTVIKFNDRQYIELYPDPDGVRNQSMYYALETDDAEAWREYLFALGEDVPADPLVHGRTCDLRLWVPTPPSGAALEIVQQLPDDLLAQTKGQYLPEGRVSDRLGHIGFMVADMDQVNPFFTNVLDMKESWRGGSRPDVVQWVHMQLPESEQTIEYMLYDEEPSRGYRGVMNHICLLVSDVDAAQAILTTRTLPEGCRNDGIQTGADNKRQINLYTHEGIRVELVEDHFVDGIAAPSSTGQPMKYTAGQ